MFDHYFIAVKDKNNTVINGFVFKARSNVTKISVFSEIQNTITKRFNNVLKNCLSSLISIEENNIAFFEGDEDVIILVEFLEVSAEKYNELVSQTLKQL